MIRRKKARTMRRQADMDELLATVSEEAILEARREAAAAQEDSAEVRHLDGLIVEAKKR